MTQNNPTARAGAHMTPLELRATASLAAVFFLRMLGLFMILPVLPLHAQGVTGATPLSAGIALGAYGITQACLQLPFGMLSDRYGRKRVISAGLVLFAAGSAVAALSTSIGGIIAGRLLQGAGAVAAAIMALAADLTRESSRTKAMAGIGASIGLAFALAFILGPIVDASFGMSAVFWAAAGCAVLALAVVVLLVPDPPVEVHHRDVQADSSELRRVLRHRGLLGLDLGVACLHCVLTASFVVIPLALRDHAGLPAARHWQVYAPVLIASVLLMLPFVFLADRGRRMRTVTMGAVVLLGTVEIALAFAQHSLLLLAALLALFFTAVNVLEASLPAMVSRAAPADARGTALGVFSTSQFLGAFSGGVIGGYLHGAFGNAAVFAAAAGLCALWIGLWLALPRARAQRTGG